MKNAPRMTYPRARHKPIRQLNRLTPLLLAGALALFVFAIRTNVWIAAGYAIFGLAFIRVAFVQDRPLPIRWLIIFVASLQWVVAPSLAYSGVYDHYRYKMYVPEGMYMPIAVSGIFALMVGLLAFGNRREKHDQINAVEILPRMIDRAPLLPIALVGISMALSILGPFLPGFLVFAAYLATNLKYSAVILFIVSPRPDRKLWLYGIFGIAAIEAAATSLFHDFILWSVLIGSFYVFKIRTSVRARIAFVTLAIVVGVAVQSVKGDYRTEYWTGSSSGGSALAYGELAVQRAGEMISGDIALEDALESVIIRINQGWIISRIIEQVPAQIPFAEGETIQRAVEASLLPRFLAPNKAQAGGRENFIRFTGLDLGQGTSMGTSVLGEAYGNFGDLGGVLFMALYGAFIAGLLAFIGRLLRRYPLIICFLPNIMMLSIKAETDLTTVLNYLIKSSVFHIALLFFLLSIFGLKRIHRLSWSSRAT